MALDQILQDPKQNLLLEAGDVIVLVHQPFTFTVLGATGKNEEIGFEARGISLAQALARSGGLADNRASAEGVFIFRFEDPNLVDPPIVSKPTHPHGLVPVVYQINLRDPSSFFVMQNFAMKPKDVLYVSNAPAAELQKFLNLIFPLAYPVLAIVEAGR